MLPPIIIDIEASGFGKLGYPIEIGFINEQAQTWCTLIKPEINWIYWDTAAENIHQIPREHLHKHGRHTLHIAEELNTHLFKKIVYSDSWAHDFVWMSQLFESANSTPKFKLADLREVLTAHQEAVWHSTKDQVISELAATRHRASIDAKVIQLTWLRTLAVTSNSLN